MALNGKSMDVHELVTNNKSLQTEEETDEEYTHIVIEDDGWKLLYRVSDSPPIVMTFLFAFQQTLMGLPFCVMNSLLVAQAACADKDYDIQVQLLCTTIVMAAITTFLQSTFGIRLPLYQGPTPLYIIPILILSSTPEWKCPATSYEILNSTSAINSTVNQSEIQSYRETVILPRLREMQGSLIMAGGIHMLIGLTGLGGKMLNVVGPLTVVPIMVLTGIEMKGPITEFCSPHWGVAIGTFVLSVIFGVYLNGWNMPLPMISRRRGFHIVRYPLQQVLAILFCILIGWALCGILTYTGYLTSDPTSRQYKTRTDYGADTIRRTPWFIMPYPGQFGKIEFNYGIVLAFTVGTICSIVESIVDYITCSRICHLPPPPTSAVNRGIVMEGFMSMMAGFFGAGHGTTTYSNNTALIGMTKVASRRVFQMLAIQVLICGILGKSGAVLVTIPYPVLGGSMILGFGMFISLMMSCLQYADMNSARNIAVLGASLFIGLIVPTWVKQNSTEIKTGNGEFDRFLVMMLSNPLFVGGALAFILDNTVKGSKEERGLFILSGTKFTTKTEEGNDVYEIPWLTKRLEQTLPFFKYLPVFPTYTQSSCKNWWKSRSSNHKNDYKIANTSL